MDQHVIDTALRSVVGYADTVRHVQRELGVTGPFGDVGELGFARRLAQVVAADPANAPALSKIADHLHLASELMSFHHHRLDWERAHDRVNWGYVSVTIRTVALALREIVPASDHGVEPAELRLSTDLLGEVARSLSAEAIDRLITAAGDARRTAADIDPGHRVDERVEMAALRPWPVVSGVACMA